MDILALTQRKPFPPDRGNRIRTYNLLSRLGEGHRIWLVALDDTPADTPDREALETFCHRHRVVTVSPLRRALGAGRCLLRARPQTLCEMRHPAVHRQIRAWSREVDFDVAYVHRASMAPYWLSANARTGLPAVMDFVDVDSQKWAEQAARAHGLRRWFCAREQRTMRDFERRAHGSAASSLFVSQAESAAFSNVVREHDARALTNGVDGGYFARPQLARRDEPARVLFLGQMDDPANVEAVRWFAAMVWPSLRRERPELHLDIVGARPVDEVRRLEALENVRVTGWVEDVRPYLWAASVSVAPVHLSQGTQNKVLESMAASLPVVVSPMAARGLAEPSGPHLRVAGEPEAFAREVLDLLDDPIAAKLQAEAALEFLSTHHSWEAAAEELERELIAAAATREGVAE